MGLVQKQKKKTLIWRLIEQIIAPWNPVAAPSPSSLNAFKWANQRAPRPHTSALPSLYMPELHLLGENTWRPNVIILLPDVHLCYSLKQPTKITFLQLNICYNSLESTATSLKNKQIWHLFSMLQWHLYDRVLKPPREKNWNHTKIKYVFENLKNQLAQNLWTNPVSCTFISGSWR